MQPLHNCEPNLRQGFAYPAFSSPERWDDFAALAKLQTESLAYFCNPSIIANRILGKVLPPLQRSEPNFILINQTAICQNCHLPELSSVRTIIKGFNITQNLTDGRWQLVFRAISLRFPFEHNTNWILKT